jgi:hypothetical protein
MQKVQEAELTWSKSKGKGKVKVIDDLHEEVHREEPEKLKAKRAMIDNLEGNFFPFTSFPTLYLFVP